MGSDDVYWHVTGDFKGKTGAGFFDFVVKSSDFSKDQVTQMLDSMK